MKCSICKNTTNLKEYKVKEMMFGFREEFNYFECSKCKCIQISEIPDNMHKYYPSNYYSFNSQSSKNENKIVLLEKRVEK